MSVVLAGFVALVAASAAAASLIEYINHACVCIHRQITDSFAEALRSQPTHLLDRFQLGVVFFSFFFFSSSCCGPVMSCVSFGGD